MKNLPLLVAGILFTGASAADAATLFLLSPGDPTSLPLHHDDIYDLPSILGSSPVVSITVTLTGSGAPLQAANYNPGGAPTPVRNSGILGSQVENDTHLLFSPSPNITFSNIVETSQMFSVKVSFTAPIDAISGGPAALQSVSGPHSLTDLTWLVEYANGSQQTFQGGIIPEPSAIALVVGVAGLAAFRRNRR